MSDRMSQREWEVARLVCSPEQLVVMNYRVRGVGWRRLERMLGIPVSTLRSRDEAGKKRLERALLRDAA